MNHTELISEIKRLKEEKNAMILAHYYQIGEIQDIADIVGDSLALAQKAAQTETGDGKQQPHQEKLRAYLSPKVSGQGGVVPDLPFQNYVNQTAGDELDRRYDAGAEQTFPRE